MMGNQNRGLSILLWCSGYL